MIKIFGLLTAICVAFALTVSTASAASELAKQLQKLLVQHRTTADYTRLKLTIDKMVDRGIDIDANIRQIDHMAAKVRAMLPSSPTSRQRMLTLRRFIYEAGTWNGHRAFRYNLADPKGQDLHTQLLSVYLQRRKGNCISMPILFLVLGERVGLTLTLSTAPLHVFVKFTDHEHGKTYNLETTSGAGYTRDVWFRQLMPMTDEAIANGIFLQSLTRQQVGAVMALVVLEHLMRTKRYHEAIAVADVILRHYPKFAHVIAKRATAFGYLMKTHYISKYRSMHEIPIADRPRLKAWHRENHSGFARAEALGWRPTKP